LASDPEWLVLEARAFMAVRSWQIAEQRLSAARGLVVGAAHARLSPSIDRVEAELVLRRGRHVDLGSVRQRVDVAAGTDFGGEGDYSMWWTLGLVSKMTGDLPRAIAELSRAESSARASYGDAHPEVALVRLDLALAAAPRSSGLDDRQVAQIARAAAPVLLSSLPADHPAVELAGRFGPLPGRRRQISDSRIREILLEAPRGMFFI
jgi:hypothetical protein